MDVTTDFSTSVSAIRQQPVATPGDTSVARGISSFLTWYQHKAKFMDKNKNQSPTNALSK